MEALTHKISINRFILGYTIRIQVLFVSLPCILGRISFIKSNSIAELHVPSLVIKR